MIKQLVVSGTIAAAVILPVSAAHALGGDPAACDNFVRPVILSQDHLGRFYDPLHLDRDHDGIACEHNPGEPVKTDLYADLRGDEPSATPSASPTATATPSLAHTGAGDMIHKHPLRSIGLGLVLAATGGAITLVARRRMS